MPAVVRHTLGSNLLGADRLGDLKNGASLGYAAPLSVTYTIAVSKYNSALPVTYTVQRSPSSSLLVYYIVTGPSSFTMSGDSYIVSPDQIVYTPRQVTARTLLGGPILQGYSSMTWTWSVLTWNEYQRIIGKYDPHNPVILIAYPDQTGTWQQRKAAMHPPVYGTMGVGQTIQDLQITFYKLY